MKPLLRALALGAGPLVAAAGLGVMGQARPVAPLAPLPPSSASCLQPPVFQPVYQLGPGSVEARGDGFYFGGESILEASLCSAGTLRITASGERAKDEDPQLLIMLDGLVLATPRFNGLREMAITVPRAGRLYLSYLNDYYLADVRVATLFDVQLTAPGCQGFESVMVPAESAGTWYPTERVAVLVRDLPVVLVPCAAGELTFEAQGRKGNGAYPTVTFKQNGQLIQTVQTGEALAPVRLSVGATPLDVTVNNAYGLTLADRNLNLEHLKFIPRRP